MLDIWMVKDLTQANTFGYRGAKKYVIMTGAFFFMLSVVGLLIAEKTHEIGFAVSAIIFSLLFVGVAASEKSDLISTEKEKILKYSLLLLSVSLLLIVISRIIALF